MLTKRCRLPSAPFTWVMNPGKLSSRLRSNSSTLLPSPGTVFLPPVKRCSTAVTLTSTAMNSLRPCIYKFLLVVAGRDTRRRAEQVLRRGWLALRNRAAFLVRRTAAEGVVVDELGHGGIVAAERA